MIEEVEDTAPIALDDAVLAALRQLRASVQAAARAKGEVPRAIVVIWTTGSGDTVFDGGVTMLAPESDDQDFGIMADFLEAVADGARESGELPLMGALN